MRSGAGEGDGLILAGAKALARGALFWVNVVFLELRDASGIVLRGAGRSGRTGTILEATYIGPTDETDPPLAIEIGRTGERPRPVHAPHQVLDERVPVGAHTLHVESVRDFHPGDDVVVERPTTAAWIDHIGMDSCSSRGGRYDTSDRVPYTCLPGSDSWDEWPGRRTMNFDRVVVAVDARAGTITLDAPITMALDHDWGGATVWAYRFPERITQVGIELLRAESRFDRARPDAHTWSFARLTAVQDAWIRNVTVQHFARSLSIAADWARGVTVQDSKFTDPVSNVEGRRRYAFDIDGATRVLVQRCVANGGRHSFVVGGTTMGPNVFLDCEATGSFTSSETHGYWSTGTLYDNVGDTPSGSVVSGVPVGISIKNEGTGGSGHGWSGANSVLWNSRGPQIVIESPPTAQNWGIGNRGGRRGDARWDSHGTPVGPRSLYLAQLRDRAGAAAVREIAP
jgi:hypothetical protein